jgi:hypothetical protein
MLESLSLSSITMTATHLWNSATTLLRQKPVPLYQKALHESGYQAYLNFKEHVKYYPKRGFGEIISPYVLLSSKNIPGFQKAHLVRFLQNHPGKALGFFYNDLINHLVDMSASNGENNNFEAMLTFYESFVPEEIYQEVLTHYKTLDRFDLQQSILEVTRKINLSFRQMQLSPNNNQHTPNFLKLILVGTISLLASRNLGLPLGLGALSMFATPVRGAYPTVASPIPPQGTQPGELFSYEFDMNQVFTDNDGDVLSLADFKPSDGGNLPFWIAAQPKKVFGKDYPEYALDVEEANGIAYVGNGGYGCGLTTFNVTDPLRMEFLGCLRDVRVDKIALRYPYVYTGVYASGAMSVIDVSNPSFPVFIRNVPVSYVGSISLSSQYFFVTTAYTGSQIFSIQSPAYPLYQSSLPPYDNVAGTDKHLFAVNETGLYTYDISNPIQPRLIDIRNIPGHVIALQGNYLHIISNWYNAYSIVDVNNPSSLTLIGNTTIPGYSFSDLKVFGNRAVACASWPGGWLVTFDLTDFTSPSMVSSFQLTSSGEGIAVKTNSVYQAHIASGLAIINITDLASPAYFVQPEETHDYSDLIKHNTTLYVAAMYTGTLKFNISDLSNPQLISQINADFDAAAHRIVLQNNLLFTGLCSGTIGPVIFQTINVTLQNMTLLGSLSRNNYFCSYDISVYNTTAYIRSYGTLYILDFENTTSLNVIRTISATGGSAVRYPYLFVGDSSTVTVYDITNTTDPISIGNRTAQAQFLKISNNRLYVSRLYSNGIIIFDLANLPNLTFISNINTFDGNGAGPVDLSQNLLYIVGGNYYADMNSYNYYAFNGFQLANLANITNPQLLIITRTPGIPRNLVSDYPNVLVADGPSGLQIYDTSKVTISGLAPYYPTSDGNYNFTLTAINQKGETVSTSFQLHVNAPPKLLTNQLSLSQGETVTLTTQQLNAVDDATAALLLKYTVTQIAHGYFQTAQSPGVPVFGFSQQQVANGEIQFVHDGSTTPPSYKVYVNDGNLNSVPQWAAVTFNGNVLPILNTNQLTINTGQTVVLSSSNLQASDADIADINQLVFTVSNIQHGYFDLSSAPGIPITSFTFAELTAGQVRFTQDGSDSYPSYFASVSDGIFPTPPSLVNIVFNNNAVPVILNNQITISPGQNFTLSAQNIGGLDFDSNNNNLVFTINNLSGGQFQLLNNPGMAVAQFTQQDILNGNVQFIADALDCDNSTTPSYTLQANDGSFNTLFNIATVNYQRETTTNGCVVTVSSEETDKIYLYIGVGVGVAALATAATVMWIFAVKRKHMIEREKERIDEMTVMAVAAAQWKNQPPELSASAGSDEDLNGGAAVPSK